MSDNAAVWTLGACVAVMLCALSLGSYWVGSRSCDCSAPAQIGAGQELDRG